MCTADTRAASERRASVTTMNNTSTGIIDPDDSSRWLVCPWPVRATFCEVADHFLMTSVRRDSAKSAWRVGWPTTRVIRPRSGRLRPMIWFIRSPGSGVTSC